MRSPLDRLRAAAELLAASPENIANDPAELAKLLREADTAHTRFGETVSLSGDGNTALIKAVSNDFIEDKKKGGSYIFVRDRNGSWSQQAKFVSLEGFSGYTNQTVSLSSDGCTIIGSDSKNDAVYVFTKGEDGSWSQQIKIAEVYGGYPVSLSADGREALVTYRLGVDVHILVKHEDGTWSQEAELHPEFYPNHSGNVLFGLSVSLSADGQTALVGAPYYPHPDVLNFSSVYVFVKGEDGSWSQQARLTAEDKGEDFGWVVSLSADGRTALIRDNNNRAC